jgi:hypothetical protein
MGFNLQCFFEELIRDLEKLQRGKGNVDDVLAYVLAGKQYAKECNQLN